MVCTNRHRVPRFFDNLTLLTTVQAGYFRATAFVYGPLAGPPWRPNSRQGSGFDSPWRGGGGTAALRAPAVVKHFIRSRLLTGKFAPPAAPAAHIEPLSPAPHVSPFAQLAGSTLLISRRLRGMLTGTDGRPTTPPTRRSALLKKCWTCKWHISGPVWSFGVIVGVLETPKRVSFT